MGSKNKSKKNDLDKEIIKPFQLDRVRERQKKIKQHKKKSEYYPPTGLEIISNMIQKQNKELLYKIAEYKDLPDEDTDILIRLFWNPSYWIPKIER